MDEFKSLRQESAIFEMFATAAISHSCGRKTFKLKAKKKPISEFVSVAQEAFALMAVKNDCPRTTKDHHGRWKNRHISDGCDDVQLDWIDAQVAQVLCPTGICNHDVADQSVMAEWIADNVAPNIRDVFSQPTAHLFGKASLWLSMDESGLGWMPPHVRDNIRGACAAV
jgi:hypothetical protein